MAGRRTDHIRPREAATADGAHLRRSPSAPPAARSFNAWLHNEKRSLHREEYLKSRQGYLKSRQGYLKSGEGYPKSRDYWERREEAERSGQFLGGEEGQGDDELVEEQACLLPRAHHASLDPRRCNSPHTSSAVRTSPATHTSPEAHTSPAVCTSPAVHTSSNIHTSPSVHTSPIIHTSSDIHSNPDIHTTVDADARNVVAEGHSNAAGPHSDRLRDQAPVRPETAGTLTTSPPLLLPRARPRPFSAAPSFHVKREGWWEGEGERRGEGGGEREEKALADRCASRAARSRPLSAASRLQSQGGGGRRGRGTLVYSVPMLTLGAGVALPPSQCSHTLLSAYQQQQHTPCKPHKGQPTSTRPIGSACKQTRHTLLGRPETSLTAANFPAVDPAMCNEAIKLLRPSSAQNLRRKGGGGVVCGAAQVRLRAHCCASREPGLGWRRPVSPPCHFHPPSP
ncbi:MAG: hypothetical protein SGPRY_011428 [Prymnesium sp.]